MKRFYLFTGLMILLLTVLNSCKKEEDTPEPPTFEELLTGGTAATNGKTWVLSKETYPSDDGAGAITNDMFALIAIPADIQTLIGDEYDNEFTFFSDGKYTINPKNGKVLAAGIYSTLNTTIVDGSYEPLLGLCDANYTPPASATWTLNTSDFTVDAITNPLDAAVPPGHGNVTFSGKNWISFSAGAFFGILDWPTSNQLIIKDITETEMHVAMMVGIYQGVFNPGGDAFANYPTHLFQLTYVPKAK